MPRDRRSYRASRRNRARKLKQIWRTLEHTEMQGHGSPIYVPMILTQEEARDARQAR